MFRPAHVGFARLDRDRVVYLDTRADRYGCLLPPLSRALLGSEHAKQPADAKLFRLVAKGLLSLETGEAIWPDMSVPTRSALEEGGDTYDVSWSLVPRLFVLGWCLRRRGLYPSLERLLHARSRRSVHTRAIAAAAVARSFERRRALIPAARICLVDGLLLSHILLDHAIASNLVFGVRLDPFAAHCWVETDDLILSDGADRVREFTPVYRV